MVPKVLLKSKKYKNIEATAYKYECKNEHALLLKNEEIEYYRRELDYYKSVYKKLKKLYAEDSDKNGRDEMILNGTYGHIEFTINRDIPPSY